MLLRSMFAEGLALGISRAVPGAVPGQKEEASLFYAA